MISKRRKTRDIKQLSAYLDNALSARQARKLEARLATDPELREMLDNLRETKLALGRLPRLQAPRNFTLTPDMVPERQSHRQPLQVTLRLASALAAILLVVSFGAEFILGEIRQPLTMEAEAPMMQAARVGDEATPRPLIQWGPPGRGGGAVGGIGGNSEGPMLEMEAAPEEAPETEPLPEEPQEIQEDQAEAAEQPAAKSGDLILGINLERGGEIIKRSQPASTQQDQEQLPWPNILQYAQIVLALIAVAGGLALLFLRVRKRV